MPSRGEIQLTSVSVTFSTLRPMAFSLSCSRSMHVLKDTAGAATKLVSSKKTLLPPRGMTYMNVGAVCRDGSSDQPVR